MTQNLMTLDLSGELVTTMDHGIEILEAVTAQFLSMTPDEVRRIVKMGDQTEQFCRQTALVLEQNKHVLPPTLDLEDMKRDMAAYELLRPRLLRLKEVLARVEDTQRALGSDVMTAALAGYKLMKMFGKSEGLDALKSAIGTRGSGRPAKPEPTPAS